MSVVNPEDQLSAFPWVCDDLRVVAKGMTMRDYFAAQAMKYMSLPTMVYATGRIGDNTWELKSMDEFPFEDMSKVAYKFADAMMKARNQ